MSRASRAPRRAVRAALDALATFLRTEKAGGIVLAVAAAVALVWANSPAQSAYRDLWTTHLTLGVGALTKELDLTEWVNEGLMSLFFFVVGLEITREIAHGELGERRTALVPALAALGGMVVPAGIYLLLNHGHPGGHGWGIPMATDIAFALAALTLAGSVPRGLTALLLTLAIVDDIGAIVVIAVFYSHDVHTGALIVALGSLTLIVALRVLRVARLGLYLVPALVLWGALLASGVHPTLAGVALGLLAPPGPALEKVEEVVHPWVSFGVIPVFALANAGIGLGATSLRGAFGSRTAWGVALGLVVGKALGIGGTVALCVKAGWGRLPDGVGARHVVGLALFGGIGFTVSLFVSGLAFRSAALLEDAKVGVVGGSLVSAAAGLLWLRLSRARVGSEGRPSPRRR